MERIWKLLVAIFFLCAGVALIALAWVFEHTMIAMIAIFIALVFILIGLIKGIYNLLFFGPEEDSREE